MACLRHMVFAAAAAVLLVHVFGAATMVKRSETSNQEAESCSGRTPCGWAIYNRTTRYIEYFMKNRCFCDNEKKCLRDDDDISIAAYVYRCKVEVLQEGSKS
ncbi:uncharacterized protein LOC108910492 [Anoplophora glabripennis]|uniref:uncharacterized protein LOC108910492 n=1 Tax=Anoplophora glabripennis TaxID=217634 RepID=UPI0008743F81|nr:uncharacterized protein LOC108910492 [Anoplophora glabripennis]